MEVIAIDGPAGSGKGAAGDRVALELEFERLDSGMVYRSVAAEVLAKGIMPDNDAEIIRVAKLLNPIIPRGKTESLAEKYDRDILHSPAISKMVSIVAKIGEVRNEVNRFCISQRKGPGLVVDGRDACMIFDTPYRFFLKADPEVCAMRRAKQLAQKDRSVRYEDVLEAMRQRDEQDRTRKISPLRPHPEAYEIDTTKLTIDEVVSRIVIHYHKVRKGW